MPLRTALPDPSLAPVECEICGVVLPVGESFSFSLGFATTGPHHIAGFTCEAGQHYACSEAHAEAAAIACIREHLLPRHAEHVERKLAHERSQRGDTAP